MAEFDGYEAYAGEFSDQESERLRGLFQYLQTQFALLSTGDQEFILGCDVAFSTGGALTAENRKRLAQIVQSLTAATHNSLGSSLSMNQVIKDLSSVVGRLTPQERQFAGQMATKLKNRMPLDQQEVRMLVQLHTAKGF